MSRSEGLENKGTYRKGFSSRFAVAFLLFLLANCLCLKLGIGNGKPIEFPELTWTGWTIKDFFSQRKNADIVFLGSSLMLVPIAGADADFLQKRLDGSCHHHSVYFESTFRKYTQRKVNTFNFALPGEMPSDAYMAMRFLFRGAKHPRVLVWGVGPRDFMDNLLPSPASTDPFHNLARFGDIGPICDRVMSSWHERFDFLLGRLLFLYGNKEDLAYKVSFAFSSIFNSRFPAPKGGKSFVIFDRRSLLPDYRSCELNQGEAFFRPRGREDATKFSDNIAEYKRRYQSVKWDTFVSQMEFFADTLNLAKQEGIHVVLVIMPITKINRELIADYAWDAYWHSLRVIARSKGASLVDLYSDPKFQQSDFMDTVHLHSGGGKKMLDALLTFCLADPAVHRALAMPTEMVRNHSIHNSEKFYASLGRNTKGLF